MGRRPRTRQGSEESKKYLQNIMKTLYFCQKFEINQQSFFMIKSILFFIHLDPDTAYDKRPLCQKPKVMSWSMNLSIRTLFNLLQFFEEKAIFHEVCLKQKTLERSHLRNLLTGLKMVSPVPPGVDLTPTITTLEWIDHSVNKRR